MKVLKVHKRDPNISQAPLCSVCYLPEERLADDNEKVTCGRCLRMIERRNKYESEAFNGK